MVTQMNKSENPSLVGKIVQGYKRVIYPLSSIANAVGAVLLMVMMLFVTLDVILRSVANIAVLGTVVYESVGFMMIVLVFFALGYCQVKKAHINIDMLIIRFPAMAQRIINSVLLFICIIFFVLLTWQSVLRAFELRYS